MLDDVGQFDPVKRVVGLVVHRMARRHVKKVTAEFAAIPSGSNLLKNIDRRCSLTLDLRLIA